MTSQEPKCIPTISFSGGGFNAYYQFGVVSYLQKHMITAECAYGASMGAVAALALICNIPIEKIWDMHWTWRMDRNTPFQIASTVEKHVMEVFDQLVKDPDLYIRANGRLNIVVTDVTNFPFIKMNIISNFKNNADLMCYLIASMHIPYWTSSKLYKCVELSKYVDGAILNNIDIQNTQIELSDKNIRVYSTGKSSYFKLYSKYILFCIIIIFLCRKKSSIWFNILRILVGLKVAHFIFLLINYYTKIFKSTYTISSSFNTPISIFYPHTLIDAKKVFIEGEKHICDLLKNQY